MAGLLVYAPAADGADLPPADAVINGYVTDGSDPIENAYVKGMLMLADGIELASDFTDSAGYYEIGVPGGFDLMVMSVHEDYYFAMEMVSVGPGETVSCDFTLTLISESRDVTIMGYVIDDGGSPVTTATVVGISMDPMSGDMPFYGAVTLTDGGGYFEVDVIASAGGGGAILMDWPGYNMAGNETDDPLVSMTSYWFNITLEPAAYNDDCMVYGQVFDGVGTPIGGVVVSIRTQNTDGEFSNYTFTDSDGYYFVNITNGSAEITWAKGGYASYQLNWDISEGQMLEWNPNLMVLDGMMRGNVTDLTDDSPLEGARVLQMVSGVDWARWYSMAMTDSSGAYELGTFGASGDGVFVMAEAEGYSRNYSQMDMPSGADLWMDFGLWPIDCAVTGEVMDAVTLLPIEGVNIHMQSDSFEMYTNSAPNGSYYADMVAGTYDVSVWSMDYKYYEDTVDLTSGLLNWYNISLVPYVNSVLEGTVTNFYNGTPVEGAFVEVWGPTYESTYTDASGWYTFDLPDGDYWFQVNAPDYEMYSSSVTTPEMGTETHDVDLIPNVPPAECLLWGNTTEESGLTPVPWATIRVSILDAYYENTTMSNETGYYEMWVPNYADVRVTAWANDHMAAFDQIDTTSVTDYELQLPLASDTVGPVVDFSVDPAESVSVYNPAAMFGTVIEEDLRTLTWFTLQEYNSSASFANYTMLEHRQASTDPYGYITDSLVYSHMASDLYEVDFAWDSTVPNILTLDDGTITQALMYWETWMDGNQYYAVNGMCSNSSGDTFGQMTFNRTTGAVAYFVSNDPSPLVSTAPLDPGTFAPMAMVMVFSEASGWNPITMTNPYLEPMDVDTLTATNVGLVPSGSCKAALVAEDWAQHADYVFVNFTVDNDPPVADAGADSEAVVNTDVTVDGSGSTDNVGVVDYSWSVEDPTGDVMLYSTETIVLTPDETGDYVCDLTVTDAAGYSDTDTVVVTVVDDVPPVADAGPDQTIPEDTPVTFDGSASEDDVDIVNYTWYIESEDVELYGVSPEYTFTEPGTYQVWLTVNDTIGQASDPADVMVVTVTDTTDPIADAGADQTVSANANVTFDGTSSTDNGVIADYVWTFDDGTGEVTLTGPTPYHVFEALGECVVTLNVTDSDGNWATDTMTVTVVHTEPPVADAGEDAEITAGDTHTFDGSGSSDDVDIVDYTWTFTDVTDQELTGETPDYEFLNEGEFVVTLTVTDAEGQTDIDTVTVRVAASNEAPLADAGIDQTASAGGTVTFDGAGSTDDVEVTNYTWTFTYDGSTVTLYGAAPTFVFDVAGTYTVTLTVTDADDLSDTDTVEITVQESSKTFIENYWWLLVVVAVVVVAGVVLLTMGKGKGRTPSKVDEDEDVEDVPPAPPEDEEL
jgi:PKD repeat protein/protocatechuate 3,4-dioxygenase beta subunit